MNRPKEGHSQSKHGLFGSKTHDFQHIHSPSFHLRRLLNRGLRSIFFWRNSWIIFGVIFVGSNFTLPKTEQQPTWKTFILYPHQFSGGDLRLVFGESNLSISNILVFEFHLSGSFREGTLRENQGTSPENWCLVQMKILYTMVPFQATFVLFLKRRYLYPTPTRKWKIYSHTIHGTGIFTYIYHKNRSCSGGVCFFKGATSPLPRFSRLSHGLGVSLEFGSVEVEGTQLRVSCIRKEGAFYRLSMT